MGNSFQGKKRWDQLNVKQQDWLFSRYKKIVSQRASNAYVWGIFFAKMCITANAGGLIAAMAFIGQSIRANIQADFKVILISFGIGLGSGIVLVLIGLIKSYVDLSRDAKYFQNVLSNDVDSNVLGGVTQKLIYLPVGLVFGVLASIISISGFIYGFIEGIDTLSGIMSKMG